MQKNGNTRLDLLHVTRLLYSLNLANLKVGANKKNQPSFKLDQIAPLNGFKELGAHSASVDVRALAHLAAIVRSRAPDIWHKSVSLWSQKAEVHNLLMSNEVVVAFEWNWQSGKPIFKAIAPLCPSRSYPGEFLCFDLQFDQDRYRISTAESLTQQFTIGTTPRPVCPIRLNAVPVVFAVDDPIVSAVLPDTVRALVEKAKQLRNNADLIDRIVEAAELRRGKFDAPKYFEQQLYSGGFTTNAEQSVMRDFHQAEGVHKYRVLRKLTDERMKYFAARVVYEDWPDSLPRAEFQKLDRELLSRMHCTTKEPFATLNSVTQDISKLSTTADPAAAHILSQYRSYIETLNSSSKAA